MQKIVDNIVAWCPRVFRSSAGRVEETLEGWFANFVSIDTTLIIRDDRIMLMQPHTTADIYLGTTQDWERGITPDCAKIPPRLRTVFTFD